MRGWGLAALLFAAAAALAYAGESHAGESDGDKSDGGKASAAASDEEVARFLDELERYAGTVIDAAQGSRNPRVLIAAASLALIPFHEVEPALAARRDELVARATRLGGDDPLVWWLLASDWQGLPPERRADAVQRLRRLVPNNAFAWLLAADNAGDADADFVRTAQANRIDVYEGEYVRALYAAASAVPAPAFMLAHAGTSDADEPQRDTRLHMALHKWMERVLPPLDSLLKRCNGTLSLAGARLEQCLALSRLMVNRSRNMLMQRLGTSLLLQRLPPGKERDAVEAARRRLDWMQEQSTALMGDEWPAGVERWLEPDGDEFTATRAMLEAHGIPLDPPSGWRSRSQPVLPAPPPAD
jgi:hypothetical protein